eukprot:2070870-Pyramimonas_sp.AAC.2
MTEGLEERWTVGSCRGERGGSVGGGAGDCGPTSVLWWNESWTEGWGGQTDERSHGLPQGALSSGCWGTVWACSDLSGRVGRAFSLSVEPFP